MRLKEFTTKYYHGSVKEFPVGFILDGNHQEYTTQRTEVEKIIDVYIDDESIPRSESVYMTDNIDDIDNAGGYNDFVYEVVPIGQVDKNDLGWYSDIAAGEAEDEEEWAYNYWDGEQHPEGVWEYRARQAKIVRIIE